MDSPRSDSTTSPVRWSLRNIELPWLILGALLLSTLVAAFQNTRQLQADAESRFQDIATSEARLVGRHLRDIEILLQGTSAVLAVVPRMDAATWDAYFDARRPALSRFGGLVALQYLPADGSAPLTRVFDASAATRQAIPPLKSLAPVGQAITESNGESGVVLSARLGSVPGLATRGSTRAMALRTAKGHLVGIIDLGAMMQYLAAGRTLLVAPSLLDDPQRRDTAGDTPLLTSAPMSADLPVEFGRQVLTLRVNSTPALEVRLQNNTPRTILLIGVLGTVLLAGLIWLLTRLREQAEALAASMTQRLQDQTKFTEDLIEFNPSPIFRKDIDGRFVSVNRAWEQLSGHSRRDILGKTYADFQDASTARLNDDLDRKLLASETGYEMVEAIIGNASGKEYETIVAKQVIRGSDGKVEGLIGTITDVTPIKRLERELAQQREQLNLVIRSSQQGIWDIELSPGGARYYSPRFREILGYGDGGFPVAFDWQQTLHADDVEAFRAHMISHFKGETPLFDIESRVRCKDGSYAWVRTRAIAQRDAQGRAVRFVGSISDVTDRKEAEMKLVEANVRVTQAARAKEAFLATMSHEIRTPLNGVLGMTSLLAETTLNDEQRDYIRLIRASGDTLLRLIDDVLDFSKIESGHMTLESVPVEIVPVVEEAFELVAEKAREKELALLFDMQEDVPFYLLGDATRLRQILLNLLANAIKFTARGEVKLSLDARRLNDGSIELEGRVRDTGIGIPADRAGRLFQPFTQVDASTTRKYGGTGLGLAICKRLTQLMGGDIRVESVEGQGSTFIFTVLTQAARGPLKPYMQRDVFDFMGKRLLVVDRNESRRPILARRYARWGFETTVVAHDAAAEAFRSAKHLDVLLTDMVAPTDEARTLQALLDADDAARRARNEPLLVSILQSSISRAELAERGITPPLRHDAFIVRPAGRARLFDVLLRAVLHEPNHDIATRPYTAEPVYDREFRDTRRRKASQEAVADPVTGGVATAVVPGVESMRVLVAEDNEVNQRVIQGMLASLGHRCKVVGDGIHAVEGAMTGEYDVILMDIHMPELDGVEAMRQIRARLGPQRCPPIAAMTAHALSGDREHYLGTGMDDYLSKPIRKTELAALLHRASERRRAAGHVHPVPASPAPAAQAVSKPAPTDAGDRLAGVPVLDTEQVEDLRYLPSAPGDNGDGGSVGGLIRMFQAKAIERMDLMRELIALDNWHELAEVAHSLRGASASMGFPRVASLCKDMELGARALEKEPRGDARAAMDDLLGGIRQRYAEADRALADWLAKTTTPAS